MRPVRLILRVAGAGLILLAVGLLLTGENFRPFFVLLAGAGLVLLSD